MNKNSQVNEGPFKSDLIGLLKSIETIAIITASNPKGIHTSNQDNNRRNEKLEMQLKDGKYVFRKVIGQYNSVEHSYVISNISLDEVKNLAARYEQESFIFGCADDDLKSDKNNRKCIMAFEYWQTDISLPKITSDDYSKLSDVDRVVYTDKAVDFFTRMKNFKFNLPFSIFESMLHEYDSFKIPDETMVSIREDLHKGMSGKHLWKNRAINYKRK